jgi:hypothetical protein
MNSKPKKILDTIKLRNYNEASMNLSALKGLRRINTTLSRFIKLGLALLISGFSYFKLKSHFNYIMNNSVKNLEEKVTKLQNIEKFYLERHKNLMLDYAVKESIDNSEESFGIIDVRNKYMKYANGLVLETCKQ